MLWLHTVFFTMPDSIKPKDIDPPPNELPLAEPAAAIPEMLANETITLSPEHRNGLEQKLREYDTRLAEHGEPVSEEITGQWDREKKSNYLDSLYKKRIAEAVLAQSNGVEVLQAPIYVAVISEATSLGLDTEHYRFFNAWHVIRDYCTTGGQRVIRASEVGGRLI